MGYNDQTFAGVVKSYQPTEKKKKKDNLTNTFPSFFFEGATQGK